VEHGDDPAGALIWGPGEPLVNASTYVVLRKLQWLYPDLPVTVCTNGILLPDRLEELVRSGVSRLVLSINAVTPETAERIYESVNYRTRQYTGRATAELVLQQQWNGLENAVEAGLSVTVYTAVMNGINEQEVGEISSRAKEIGAERIVKAELDVSAE
jgi:nitrogen fixation protein NifB